MKTKKVKREDIAKLNRDREEFTKMYKKWGDAMDDCNRIEVKIKCLKDLLKVRRKKLNELREIVERRSAQINKQVKEYQANVGEY